MFLSSSSNKKYENRLVIIWLVSQIEATVGHGRCRLIGIVVKETS